MKRTVMWLVIAALLALAAVAAGSAWLLYSSGGARWLFGQVQDRVPGELRVARLEGSLASGLQVEGLHFADASTVLEVASARIVVRAGFGPLTLHVRDLQADGVRYRMVDAGPEPAPAEPVESLVLPLPVEIERLAVKRLVVEDAAGERLFEGGVDAQLAAFERLEITRMRVDSPLGMLEARGTAGLASPWPLQLALGGDLRSALSEGEEPVGVRFDARLDGPVDAYRLAANGVLDAAPLGAEHRFELEAGGSLERIEIATFTLDGPAARLRTRALLDWTAQRLELSGLNLVVPGSPFVADADLLVDLGDGRVAGEVGWRDFTWPLRDAPARVSSPAGSATIAGTPDDWTVEGHADLAAEGAPPAELRFQAAGDRQGLRAEIAEGRALDGTFGGVVAYSWAGAQDVAATLRFRDLGTAALLPGWPGRLTGELTLEGALEPLDLAIDVARLDGELRGAAVAGAGRVRIAGQRMRFDGFTVQAGGSRVRLQGDAYDTAGLAFEIEVAQPGALVPGLGGRASGRGTLSLASDTPRVTLDLEGADIAYGDLRVDHLALRNEPGAAGRWILRLEAGGIEWGGQALDTLVADLDWSAANQALALRAERAPHTLSARAAGALDDPGAPVAEWRWAGQLSDLTLDEAGEAWLKLAAPAPLELGQKRSEVGDACLESPAGPRFCLGGTWDVSAGAAGRLSLEHFPLDLAARRLATGIEATQSISGTLEFRAPPGSAPSATADLRLTPGALRYIDDPDVALETAAGQVAFTVADGRVSAGRVDVPMPGQGGIELDFEVEQLTAGTESPVSGSLRMELRDLDVLTLLIPVVDRMAGSLSAVFDLTGTVGDPGLDGQIALRDGAVSNLASGFGLDDIQLSGAVGADRQTRLSGQFRAVEGTGRLDAVLDLRDLYDPQVTLEIGGENLVLFDIPTLMITATPDLLLHWRSGAVEIGGELAIPRALVAPKTIPAGSVAESPDAVIVAGELPEQQAAQKASPLDIRGSLAVTLGPDVRVKLPVAEATVAGTARFSWDGGPIPTGDGAFRMNGEILALGQLLEITDGTVSFPGARADNPHLNIYAERDIYGNSEIRHAGVLVAGTLRRPVIEPYTDPMTNRERARTLLITGSDFNMERGVGTVDVGTYIAPRIFVSYGIGVFDQESVFSVRYDLGRGWGVKATSGESQTGVDISYTLER